MIKTTAIACAVATAAMGFSGASFAQEQDRAGRGQDRAGQRQAARDAAHFQRTDRTQWAGQQRPAPQPTYQAHAQPRYDYRSAPAPRYSYPAPRYSYPAPQYSYPAPRYSYGAPHYAYQAAPRYVYNAGYGYAAQPRYYVGGYYGAPRYVVSNWNTYPGLYAPPYGYQWVRADTGEFLLVAIASGIIAHLLMFGAL